MAGFKWSEVRDRIKNRLRDTKTVRSYSDALLLELANDEQQELASDLIEFDPSLFLKMESTTAEASRDTYDLPKDFAKVMWIERGDYGTLFPKIPIVPPDQLEKFRYRGVDAGFYTTYTSLPTIQREAIALIGDRFRVVPTPQSTTPVWRIWYQPVQPDITGDEEPVAIPRRFTILLVLGTCLRALRTLKEDASDFQKEHDAAWERMRRDADRESEPPIVVPAVWT